MRTKEFLSKLDHHRIVQAIRDAESKSSGQIRVFLQRGELAGDALPVAQKSFQKLGVHKTKERNGVLIFIAPRARKFAIVGDEAIHKQCGEEFWERLAAAMRGSFQQQKFSEALVEAIDEAGKLLAAHFPKSSTSSNELPDEIVEG